MRAIQLRPQRGDLGERRGSVLAGVLLGRVGLLGQPARVREVLLQLRFASAPLRQRLVLAALAQLVELLSRLDDLGRAGLGLGLRLARLAAGSVGVLARGVRLGLEAGHRFGRGAALQPEDHRQDERDRVLSHSAGIDAGRAAEPHAFGRELLFEHGQEQFLGGPRVGGALEHHQLARVDPGGGRLGGGHDGGDVGVLRLPERRGHADDHDVASLQHASVHGSFVPAVLQKSRELLVRDVRGARAPEVKGDHPVQVGVEAVHGEACPGELDRQRQADVPLADDGEPCGATLDAPVERGCVIHAGFSLNVQTVRARQFRPRRQRRARRAS